MISEKYGQIGTLLPYVPLQTPLEFIRSEYQKVEIARAFRSSLSSSVSTVVSFGSDSSTIRWVGSSFSSSLSKESASGCLGDSLLDSQNFVWDQFVKDLSFEMEQLNKLYRKECNTQRLSLKTWQQLGEIEEGVLLLLDESGRKMVGTVVGENVWNEVSSARDRVWELFCASTQAIVDIAVQIIKCTTKSIEITESC